VPWGLRALPKFRNCQASNTFGHIQPVNPPFTEKVEYSNTKLQKNI
jgi:hypothetical protein